MATTSTQTTALTGKTVLGTDTITEAKKAISKYQASAITLQKQLAAIMSGLMPSSFKGKAATGYQYFYDNNVLPAINNLTEDDKLIAGISKMLDSIDKQLLGTVDPELEKINRNPGSSSANNS